jgi:hypothetical protein
MDPTRQEETKQKLSTKLTALQAQVNREIPTIHAKMDFIRERLGSQIVEVHYALHQFMNKFHSPSYNQPLYTKGVESN